MLIMVGLQLLLWYFFTHRQSRFLLPTMLPLCVLIGIGCGRLDQLLRKQAGWGCPALMILTVLLLTANALDVLYHQTYPRTITAQGITFSAAEELVDSIPKQDDLPTQPGQFEFGDHPINFLPADSVTLMIADAGSTLYVRRPVIYQSAHDRNLLSALIYKHKGKVGNVTKELTDAGITHVWINFHEVRRLENTYWKDRPIRNWLDLSDESVKGDPRNLQLALQRFNAVVASNGWQLISQRHLLYRLPQPDRKRPPGAQKQ